MLPMQVSNSGPSTGPTRHQALRAFAKKVVMIMILIVFVALLHPLFNNSKELKSNIEDEHSQILDMPLNDHQIPLLNFLKSNPTAEVLTFGDSLTHGMSIVNGNNIDGIYPYSKYLKKFFINDEDTQTIINESGISGELASRMIKRLPNVIKDHKNVRVISILAGTNDLGHQKSPIDIAQSIIDLHEIAHTSNTGNSDNANYIYTILLTIPQINWRIKQNDRLIINKILRNYVLSCNTGSGSNVVGSTGKNTGVNSSVDVNTRVILVDIENEWDQKNEKNDIFWSIDKVHLSEKGYEALARKVYVAMKNTMITPTLRVDDNINEYGKGQFHGNRDRVCKSSAKDLLT
jgi:lysophospholipase L1-like esterase